jgi:ATP-dependent Lon protease
MINNINLYGKEASYVRHFTMDNEKYFLKDINNHDNITIYYKEFANQTSRLLFDKNLEDVDYLQDIHNMESFFSVINDILFKKEFLWIERNDLDNIMKPLQLALVQSSLGWLNDLKNLGKIDPDRLTKIKNNTLVIEYIPDDKDIVNKIIEESKKGSVRVKHRVDRVNAKSDPKMMILSEEEAVDIFINEEKAIKQGDTISTSPEIRRASILKDNCHMLRPYPLQKVDESAIAKLEEMKIDFPNFVKVIDDVIGFVVLSLLGKQSYFHMKPILLAGDPGVGKTAFAQKVSKILELGFKKLPFTTISAAWVITGLDLSWNGGKQGKLFDFLASTEMANPIVFLDELDKSKQGDSGGNPLDTLHDLLESETSIAVWDEAMNMSMNASKVIWMATANNLDKIPESILSRFQVFTIEDIKEDSQKVHVIKNVYRNMINNMPDPEIFESELDDELAFLIKKNNIRVISNKLSAGIAKAAKREWFSDNKEIIKLIAEDLH